MSGERWQWLVNSNSKITRHLKSVCLALNFLLTKALSTKALTISKYHHLLTSSWPSPDQAAPSSGLTSNTKAQLFGPCFHGGSRLFAAWLSVRLWWEVHLLAADCWQEWLPWLSQAPRNCRQWWEYKDSGKRCLQIPGIVFILWPAFLPYPTAWEPLQLSPKDWGGENPHTVLSISVLALTDYAMSKGQKQSLRRHLLRSTEPWPN
jgi:hypothetical protein